MVTRFLGVWLDGEGNPGYCVHPVSIPCIILIFTGMD